MLYLFFFSYIMCVCACMRVGQKTLGSLISSPRDLDQPEASVSPGGKHLSPPAEPSF